MAPSYSRDAIESVKTIMKKLCFSIILAALLALLSGCASQPQANEPSDGEAEIEITGPAFVLFFTDN